MARRYTRAEARARLKKSVAAGKPIIIAGAGDGLVAKLEEKGGADIIGAYNSGRFRHYGVGSLGGLLPIGNANKMVIDLAYEVMPRVKEAIVIAGICAQDPNMIWESFFKRLGDLGFSGVMNFPTVGLIDADSRFRSNLEESGFGYDKEAEVLKKAHDMDIFTIGYCFTKGEAKKVAKAGVDILACHVGLTAGGLLGAKTTITLDDCVKITNNLIREARKVSKTFIPITHGGPLESPESVRYVLKRTEAVGFLGATAVERLPVEKSVPDIVKRFKNIPIKRRKL